MEVGREGRVGRDNGGKGLRCAVTATVGKLP